MYPQDMDLYLRPYLSYSNTEINGDAYIIGTAEFLVNATMFDNELFDFDDVAAKFEDSVGRLISHQMFGRDKVQFRYIVDISYTLDGSEKGFKVHDTYTSQYESIRYFDTFQKLTNRMDKLTDSVVEYLSALPDALYSIRKFKVEMKYKL